MFCMNVYLDNLQKPIEFQGRESKFKVTEFFVCFVCTIGYCGYPRAVLSLEQDLTIFSLPVISCF